MRWRLRTVLLVLLSASAAAQEPVRLETSIAVVSVDVSVLSGGRALPGLAATDFEVRDEGDRRAVGVVAAGELPLHVLLVMDTSASVAGPRLERLRAAAMALLGDLRPGDRAGILTFNERPRLVASVEASPISARALVARLTAGGATALRDAVWAALTLADRVRGRLLVVLTSDGADSASWLAEEAVLARARESNAVLHVIASSGGRPDRLDAGFLGRLATTTGGRLWSVEREDDLEGAVRRALLEMRSRYVLSFERPPDAKPGWHRLEVRLRDREADVLARRGYFVPSLRK